MKTVMVLYLCTGSYIAFWQGFYESAERYFLPECRKEYYVFTDQKNFYAQENERVTTVPIEPQPWPLITLLRYRYFSRVLPQMQASDYAFFCNSNLEFLQPVHASEVLPAGDQRLVVVQHPGFYNKSRWKFTYERSRKSEAYIPYGKGTYYVAGGLNGGTGPAFAELTQEIRARAENDLRKNIIAIWHDESHLNRYVYDHIGGGDLRSSTPAICTRRGGSCRSSQGSWSGKRAG